MIETREVRNRVLARVLEQDDGVRQYVVLEEIGSTALRRQATYFPVTAVLAAVTSDQVDAVLIRPDECSWIEPYSAVVQPRYPGHAYTVPSDLLRAAAFRHVLPAEAARMHCRAIETLSHLATQPRSRSVARYLLEFRQTDLPLAQQTIADAVDSRRETVTEILAKFERQGWIRCSRCRVVIVDAAALQNYAVGDLELAVA